ncbi:MAG: hypothetical protein SFW36_03160 [Leptolyngbyaceae cyanobacterium bins.59]|nr:hypothetical protein [Leptolyngbyaceae cyanobacterium bins.59]
MRPRDEEKGMVLGVLLLLGLHVFWILFSGFVIQLYAPLFLPGSLVLYWSLAIHLWDRGASSKVS